MQPEVFYLNEKYCCLIYKDYLVVNLPIDKIQERINMIDTNWRSGYWKRFKDYCIQWLLFRFFLANNSNGFGKKFITYTTVSFKLNKYFKMNVAGSLLGIWRIFQLMFVNLNSEFVEGQKATLVQWLDRNLSERGFSKKTKKLSKKTIITEWVPGFILLVIVLFAIGYEGPPTELWVEIVAAAIFAGIFMLFFELVAFFIRRFFKIKKDPIIEYRKK